MVSNVLKKKDFLLLMQGKFVSLIGSEMQATALSLYVLAKTGSATKFASVLAITIIPKVILGPIAGVFADWFDRKKIVVGLDFLNGLIIALYACIFHINGGISMPYIYVLTVSLAIIELLFQPAVGTIIPSIVKKEELVAANGINSTIMNIGLLLSPCIGAILYGIKGLGLVFIINAISFTLSAISEMFINVPKLNKRPEKINFKVFRKDFLAGLNFVKERKVIKAIIKLGIILNFAFNSFISIGVLYISKQILKVSDYQYGIMQSVLVIGMFIAPVLCAYLCKKMKIGKLMFIATISMGISVSLVSLCASKDIINIIGNKSIIFIILTVLCICVVALGSATSMALGISVQQQVSVQYLGRVSTVINALLMAASPLGSMFFGMLYDKIPASIVVIISSSIVILASILLRRSLCLGDEEANISSQEGTVYEN